MLKLTELARLEGAWDVAFDPKWGGPAEARFPVLMSWTKSPKEGIKFYSGTAIYRKDFNLDQLSTGAMSKKQSERVFLDLGDVKNVAEVRLNGKELGILWCAPWRVEITGIVQEENNHLEVEVTNLWANRVIRDLQLPMEKRLTKTHEVFRFEMLNPHTPILESGLLGPVTLYSA